MNTLQEKRTLEVIGAEIRTFTASMLNNIIEIGRRMCEAKELLEHGAFMPWIEEATGYSQSTANNFMRLYEEYGDKQGNLFGAELSNSQTFGNLTYSKALALLALPSGERETFVEAHDVDAMTTRELQAAIRERDEAKARAEKAEQGFDEALRREKEANEKWNAADEEAEQLRERVKELEARPVDVAVQVDEEAVKKAADEARKAAEDEWSARVRAAEKEAAAAQKELARMAEAEGDTKELDAAKKAEADARAETERLRAELEKARREQKQAAVSGDAELAVFQQIFESVQGEVNKMHGILLKVREHDEALAGKLAAALTALAEKVKECAK